MKELTAMAKKVDVSDLRARVRPIAEAATQAAKAARDTVRERAPTSDQVLRGLGLERRRSRWSNIVSWPLILAAAAGATVVFLLDPQQGARRRAVTRDRLVGVANQVGKAAQHTGRIAVARAQGMTNAPPASPHRQPKSPMMRRSSPGSRARRSAVPSRTSRPS